MLARGLVGVVAVTGVLLLGGCSPHPGSGGWLLLPGQQVEFERIEVMFDGKAELFRTGETQAGLRCFWGGDSRRSLRMTCTSGQDSGIEYHYELQVVSDDQANLMQNGQLLGTYARRQGPPLETGR